MNQRTLLDRLLSPAGFGLVLLLFLLPFATLSCTAESEQIDATFTGLDFIVGGEPTISGTNIDDEVAPELAATFIDFYQAQPLAIIAAVLLLAGMAAGLIGQRRLRATVSAAIAAVVVVLLAVAIFVQAPKKFAEAVDWLSAQTDLDQPIEHTTSPAIGFWIAIVLLVALAGWQGYEATRAGGAVAAAGSPPPGHAPRGDAPPGEVWPADASGTEVSSGSLSSGEVSSGSLSSGEVSSGSLSSGDVSSADVSSAEVQESWRAPER